MLQSILVIFCEVTHLDWKRSNCFCHDQCGHWSSPAFYIGNRKWRQLTTLGLPDTLHKVDFKHSKAKPSTCQRWPRRVFPFQERRVRFRDGHTLHPRQIWISAEPVTGEGDVKSLNQMLPHRIQPNMHESRNPFVRYNSANVYISSGSRIALSPKSARHARWYGRRHCGPSDSCSE